MVYPNSVIFEVKATNKMLKSNYDRYQLGAMIDYLANTTAGIGHRIKPELVPPPVMNIITFSGTKVGTDLIKMANDRQVGLVVIHAYEIVYLGIKTGRILFGRPIPLNDYVDYDKLVYSTTMFPITTGLGVKDAGKFLLPGLDEEDE